MNVYVLGDKVFLSKKQALENGPAVITFKVEYVECKYCLMYEKKNAPIQCKMGAGTNRYKKGDGSVVCFEFEERKI